MTDDDSEDGRWGVLVEYLPRRAAELRRQIKEQPDGGLMLVNDAASLLEEAAAEIAELRMFIRAMDHAIQSSWRAMPVDIASHFANDETIDSQNRLPSAVAWMSAMLPKE